MTVTSFACIMYVALPCTFGSCLIAGTTIEESGNGIKILLSSLLFINSVKPPALTITEHFFLLRVLALPFGGLDLLSIGRPSLKIPTPSEVRFR